MATRLKTGHRTLALAVAIACQSTRSEAERRPGSFILSLAVTRPPQRECSLPKPLILRHYSEEIRYQECLRIKLCSRVILPLARLQVSDSECKRDPHSGRREGYEFFPINSHRQLCRIKALIHWHNVFEVYGEFVSFLLLTRLRSKPRRSLHERSEA